MDRIRPAENAQAAMLGILGILLAETLRENWLDEEATAHAINMMLAERNVSWRLVRLQCNAMPARIVVTHYRYKRPPPKKTARAVEIAPTVVVRPAKAPPADERSKKRPAAKAQSAGTPSRPPLPTVVRCHQPEAAEAPARRAANGRAA